MEIYKSLRLGLDILKFKKSAILKASRDKDLEEIFLETLFFNYILVLVTFIVSLFAGGFRIGGNAINQMVFFSLLMLYPFAFNVIIYFLYSIYGYVAELIYKQQKVKELVGVGFHIGIVYAFLIYILFFLTLLNPQLGVYLFAAFFVYFIYSLFIVIKLLYKFTGEQTLLVLFLSLLIISFLWLIFSIVFNFVRI